MPNQTVLVSTSASGTVSQASGIGSNLKVAISDNGKFLAFNSRSSTLTGSGDDGLTPDIYLKNMDTGDLQRVGHPDQGDLRNTVFGGDRLLDISDDGRYVLFSTHGAKTGVANENGALEIGPHSARDLFIFDRETSAITHHPMFFHNPLAPVQVKWAHFVDNGSGILFGADPGRTVNENNEIVETKGSFHYDVATKTHTRFSNDERLLVGDNETVSDSGNEIIFTDNDKLLKLFDRSSKTTLDIGTGPVIGDVVISGNGQFIAYAQVANPTSTDFPAGVALYVDDRSNGTTRHVKAPFGEDFNQSGSLVGLSDDGRYLSFHAHDVGAWSSDPSHNVSGPSDSQTLGFIVFDLQTAQLDVVVNPVFPDDRRSSVGLDEMRISGDGSHLAYISHSNGLVENDTNRAADVFRTDNRLLGVESEPNDELKSIFSNNSEIAEAFSAAYAFLLNGVPNEAGYAFLINGAISTNFGAGVGIDFNQENKFINLVNNLVQENPTAKAKFDIIATGETLEAKVTALYKVIVPPSEQTDSGLAFITRPAGLKFYRDVAAERGVEGTDGAAIVSLAALLQIAVNGDYGIGNAVNDLLKAVAAGSAAIPATGTALTAIETADGSAFDNDDATANAITQASLANRGHEYISPELAEDMLTEAAIVGTADFGEISF